MTGGVPGALSDQISLCRRQGQEVATKSGHLGEHGAVPGALRLLQRRGMSKKHCFVNNFFWRPPEIGLKTDLKSVLKDAFDCVLRFSAQCGNDLGRGLKKLSHKTQAVSILK